MGSLASNLFWPIIREEETNDDVTTFLELFMTMITGGVPKKFRDHSHIYVYKLSNSRRIYTLQLEGWLTVEVIKFSAGKERSYNIMSVVKNRFEDEGLCKGFIADMKGTKWIEISWFRALWLLERDKSCLIKMSKEKMFLFTGFEEEVYTD